MAVKRWVIQRKFDGKYVRELHDGTHYTDDLQKASVFSVRQVRECGRELP